MPPIVLTCYNCGHRYQLNWHVEGTATFDGYYHPCPLCETPNPVPDGTYDLSDVIFKAIFQAEPTAQELVSLYQALQSATAQASPQAAQTAIKQAVPRLAIPFSDVLNIRPSAWFRFLKALLNVLSVVIGIWKGPLVGAAAYTVVAYPKEIVDKALKDAEATESGKKPKSKNQRKQERRLRAGKK